MFKMKKSVLFISVLLMLASLLAAGYFALTTVGIIEAGKVELTISLKDNSKIYDGETLTGASYEITSGSIATTHKLEVTYTSTITNVGQTPLLADARVVDESGVDVTEDYEISVVSATLSVTPRPITVKPTDSTKIYDGAPIVASDMEVIQGSLAAGHTLQPSVEVASQSVTFGTYEIRLTGQVFDFEGNDVSANYDITADNGTFIIDKAPLIIQTKSETYDFGPNMKIEPKYEIVSGELSEGDKISVRYKTPEEKVGMQVLSFEDENWISIENPEKGLNVTDSYFIIGQNVGVLTINPHTLKINVSSLKENFVYSAEEQRSDAFTYELEEDAIFMENYDITATGVTVRDAGTYENILTFVVTDKDGVDVTDYFIFEQVSAQITVDKYELTNSEFVFDNKTITYNGDIQYPHIKEAKLKGDDILDYDYKVYEVDDTNYEEEVDSIEVGEYVVIIELKGRDVKNYKIKNANSNGVITQKFEIKKKEIEIEVSNFYEVSFDMIGHNVDINDVLKTETKIPAGHSLVFDKDIEIDIDTLLSAIDEDNKFLEFELKVVDNSGEKQKDVTANYEIKYKNDKTNEIALKYEVINISLTGSNLEKIYDDEPLQVALKDTLKGDLAKYSRYPLFEVKVVGELPVGCSIAYDFSDYDSEDGYYVSEDTDADDYDMFGDEAIAVILYEDKDVTELFKITEKYGEYTIEQREVVIYLGEYEKVYDGEPLASELVHPSFSGLLDDDYEDFYSLVIDNLDIDDSDSDAGENYIISLDTDEIEDEFENYAVELKAGSYKITPKEVLVAIGHYTKVYDGEVLDINLIEPTVSGALTETDAQAICDEVKTDLDYDGIDASNIPYSITCSATSSDDNYKYVIETGSYKVTPKEVLISIGHYTKVYDGEVLDINLIEPTVSGAITVEDAQTICEDVKADLNYDGTDASNIPYPITCSATSSDDNYKYVIETGSYKVTPKEVLIAIGHYTKVYDGEVLDINLIEPTVSGAMTAEDTQSIYDDVKADLNYDGTDVSATAHQITCNATSSDSNYKYVIESGSYKVTRKTAYAIIGSYVFNKVNAEDSFGADRITVSVEGLAQSDSLNEQDIDFSFNGDSEASEIGRYTITGIYQGDLTGNYTIVVIPGILEIY